MRPRAIGRPIPPDFGVIRVHYHAVDRFRERFPDEAAGFDRDELADILESLVEEGRLLTPSQCMDRFKNDIAGIYADRRLVYSPSMHAIFSLNPFDGDWVVWTMFPAVEKYPQ